MAKPQIINPPNKLKSKVSMGGPGAVDPARLARAEAVIEKMTESYLDWVETDLAKLEGELAALAPGAPDTQERIDVIYRAAHDIKGQGIYAYVTLNAGVEPTDDLRKELIQWVRKEIGPIASPDWLQWAPGLPKTRSGKIMRRILRKIGEERLDLGLADRFAFDVGSLRLICSFGQEPHGTDAVAGRPGARPRNAAHLRPRSGRGVDCRGRLRDTDAHF